MFGLYEKFKGFCDSQYSGESIVKKHKGEAHHGAKRLACLCRSIRTRTGPLALGGGSDTPPHEPLDRSFCEGTKSSPIGEFAKWRFQRDETFYCALLPSR
jgi:hypothetical protein